MLEKHNELLNTPASNVAEADTSTPIERVIKSNPCRKCSIKKLGHCECEPLRGAAEICCEEELALTFEHEEETKKPALEDNEWERIENELFMELALTKKELTNDYSDWLHLNKLVFDPLIISEMLANKLLFIDNNKDLGFLSIFLGYSHKLLPQHQKNELKKYFDAMLRALETFKLDNGISDDCTLMERDEFNQNIVSLRINFPKPIMYAMFIEHLIKNNLIPIQNIEQSERRNLHYAHGTNHFITNPLNIRLTRNNNRSITSEQEREEEQQQNRSIRPRTMRDGLKRIY